MACFKQELNILAKNYFASGTATPVYNRTATFVNWIWTGCHWAL